MGATAENTTEIVDGDIEEILHELSGIQRKLFQLKRQTLIVVGIIAHGMLHGTTWVITNPKPDWEQGMGGPIAYNIEAKLSAWSKIKNVNVFAIFACCRS